MTRIKFERNRKSFLVWYSVIPLFFSLGIFAVLNDKAFIGISCLTLGVLNVLSLLVCWNRPLLEITDEHIITYSQFGTGLNQYPRDAFDDVEYITEGFMAMHFIADRTLHLNVAILANDQFRELQLQMQKFIEQTKTQTENTI
ncbi:hypothetical protein [Flocculibacter collagenilyticus]|uniref:hypothetical protein n=1 Tax=Flocculibacter collagenilyticus TaxID=2744479 RepID=UPI0018F36DDF|nr:hypothetical protein [Flocculibacter collagenilyticus]